MADLVNEFSWSRSRDATFQDCRRKYYLHYYGSWGGWDAAVAPDVRRLYILKQLASRQMWAGRIVHDAIEMALHIYQLHGLAEMHFFFFTAVTMMIGPPFSKSLLKIVPRTFDEQ